MRRVWVVTVPRDLIVEAGSQIMIEQFDDGPPALAFRPSQWATWSPPLQSQETE